MPASVSHPLQFSGAEIKNCCFKAAAAAALRSGTERMIKMQDLVDAAEKETAKTQDNAPSSMYC